MGDCSVEEMHFWVQPSTNDRSWPCAACGTKINSSDPSLTAVRIAYSTPPFLPFFHPPIELASARPRGRLHLDRWIDFSAICFSMLVDVIVAQIHI
jgi:hypothetical protein